MQYREQIEAYLDAHKEEMTRRYLPSDQNQ